MNTEEKNMATFFTGKGDDGMTNRLGEGRLWKSDPIIDTVGVIDELSSIIGIARSQVGMESIKTTLFQIQRDLYKIMSEVTAAPENRNRFGWIDKNQVEWVEEQIKSFEETVVSPKGFIIPGDSLSGAYLDFARTVCRRAERKVVVLVQNGAMANQTLLSYFNRLSTLFFILELAENTSAGIDSPTMAKEK
jgi:cob(I)alamin adenosyltransferase